MHFSESLSFRIIALCLAISLICIILPGIIILNSIKSSISKSKYNELSFAASELSASLSDYAHSAPALLSSSFTDTSRRVIVVNNSLNVVYDSSDIQNLTGKTLFLSPVISATGGKEFFSCMPSNISIESTLAVPVIADGKISGALFLRETDKQYVELFNILENAVFLSSFLCILLLIALSLLITLLIIRRIKRLISSVNETELNGGNIKKIPLVYNDEFSPIINKFNDIYETLDYTQKMRQVFVSDASHELRTPLAAIKLLCESITQAGELDSNTYKEFMGDIILEVDRMSHTAEKLLILSKLDNSSPPALAPIPLTDVVNTTISNIMPIASAKNVKIETYLEEDCTILGDMEGVNQIIGNLIDNAIKYNNSHGTVRIYLFSKNGFSTFITDDTGIGIPEEFRENIFERFYRVDKSRKHDGRGGSGLGLSIVKRNVESLGGSISVSDSVHGGTRFTVTFPHLSYDEEL